MRACESDEKINWDEHTNRRTKAKSTREMQFFVFTKWFVVRLPFFILFWVFLSISVCVCVLVHWKFCSAEVGRQQANKLVYRRDMAQHAGQTVPYLNKKNLLLFCYRLFLFFYAICFFLFAWKNMVIIHDPKMSKWIGNRSIFLFLWQTILNLIFFSVAASMESEIQDD